MWAQDSELQDGKSSLILHSFLAANRSPDIFKALVHKALTQIIQRSADIYLAQNQTALFSSGMSKSGTITSLCFTSGPSVPCKRFDIKDCFSNKVLFGIWRYPRGCIL